MPVVPMSALESGHIGEETKGACMGDEKATEFAGASVPGRRRGPDRRKGLDRRRVTDPAKAPVPDRRSGADRRKGPDRRKATDHS